MDCRGLVQGEPLPCCSPNVAVAPVVQTGGISEPHVCLGGVAGLCGPGGDVSLSLLTLG